MSLAVSDRPLSQVYDVAMLDLDGVVYVGADAVPGAVDALGRAVADGMRLAYVTNNASRPAGHVAGHLRSLGVAADADDVVTSAQAVAHLVADAVPAGSAVLLVGGEGLREPLEARGLRCVASLDEGPRAVVQGFHPDVGWRMLAEAAYAISAGLPWFASNTDRTFPTARGVAPGNGTLVEAVAQATGTRPVVAGKPERALFDETLERTSAQRPIMVGDRFDTDIDGAIGVGLDSLAVLTGVDTLAGTVALPPNRRPSYVGRDLSALVEAHPPVAVDGGRARCADASAALIDDEVAVESGDPRSLTALRAVVTLAWSLGDDSGVRVRLDARLGA